MPLTQQHFRPGQFQHQRQQLYSPRLELDTASFEHSSISSSPHSSQSILSQYSAVWPPTSLPAIDPATAIAIPSLRGQNQAPALMQSDSWFPYTPKSVGRFSHNRDSSLSSLGSASPASPFNHNISNPQIAVTDSTIDGFADMHSHENSYYQLAKTMGPGLDGLYASSHTFGPDGSVQDMGFPTTVAVHRAKSDRGLLRTPDFSGDLGSTRSHPTSVASSVAGDSPATPSLGEPDDGRRRKAAFHQIPKLDRTMTDVYGDELYSPNFTITSASPMQIPVSPGNDVFAQRLHAANSQHLTAGQSPVSTSSRSRSPFTQGSPLAPVPSHNFDAASSPVAGAVPRRMRFGHTRDTREQMGPEQGLGQQHMTMKSEPETPTTISPKDAILEFHEPEGETNFPLFHTTQDSPFLYDRAAKQDLPQMDSESYQRPNQPSQAHAGGLYPYAPQQLPGGIHVPQQYPFVAQALGSQDDTPRLGSSDSSSVESNVETQKPAGSGTDGGTYTCTYHGCTRRFETPALLQKHKREGHRQAQSLPGSRRVEGSVAASMMTQAGPHRCDRTNPSTGKPCNTIFSRPYDLTRHEDTIHNARKQKVRCNMCTEEKTFSRADALTRHYRVCHPDVEFLGKHRRRGGHS